MEEGQIGLFPGTNLGQGAGMGRFQTARPFMATEVEAGPLTLDPSPALSSLPFSYTASYFQPKATIPTSLLMRGVQMEGCMVSA